MYQSPFILHTVRWFNTNNSICVQLNNFKYSKWLNSSIWPIDRTLTGTTPLGQSEPESNGNEGVIYNPKAPGVGSCYQMQFSVISSTLADGGVLAEMQSVYSTAPDDRADHYIVSSN